MVLFGCYMFILKTSFEMEYISPTHFLSSRSSIYNLRSWLVWSQDLTYWFFFTQRLSWSPFIYLFLRTCAIARSQLVWDLSVFVFGMEHLVAPFCYLRNKAAFLHVCVPADEARQEKQVYVPLVSSADPTGNLWSGFSITYGGERWILPGWRPFSSSYLFWMCKPCRFGCDWQMCDVGAGFTRSFAWTALGMFRQFHTHLFAKLHSWWILSDLMLFSHWTTLTTGSSGELSMFQFAAVAHYSGRAGLLQPSTLGKKTAFKNQRRQERNL